MLKKTTHDIFRITYIIDFLFAIINNSKKLAKNSHADKRDVKLNHFF